MLSLTALTVSGTSGLGQNFFPPEITNWKAPKPS